MCSAICDARLIKENERDKRENKEKKYRTDMAGYYEAKLINEHAQHRRN